MRARMQAAGYRVSRCDCLIGTRFATHSHAADKLDGVLSGRFLVMMAGTRWEPGPGDMISVPRGVLHSAEVIGVEAVASPDGVFTGARGGSHQMRPGAAAMSGARTRFLIIFFLINGLGDSFRAARQRNRDNVAGCGCRVEPCPIEVSID